MGLDQIPCLSDMPLDAECVVRSHLRLSEADSNNDRHTKHANGEYSYRLGNGYRSHFGLAPTAQAKRHLYSPGSWLAGSGGSPPRAACLSPDPAIPVAMVAIESKVEEGTDCAIAFVQWHNFGLLG